MLKYMLMVLPILAGVACVGGEGNDRINGPVNVAAGQPADDASTVNGAIHVAADATVKNAETVNGSITIGDRAAADSVATVNGSISIGEQARVTGNVSSVNGALTLRKGADVAGALTNVNGQFTLEAAHVAGGIKTVAGDITVGADSRVEGGIRVEKPDGISISFTSSVPVVIIGPGAVVQGPLSFEREVKLFVSDRATIGAVTGATPIAFSGENPPG